MANQTPILPDAGTGPDSILTAALADPPPFSGPTPRMVTVQGLADPGQVLHAGVYDPGQTGPVSWQWQQDLGTDAFLDIPGATAPDYTVAAPTVLGLRVLATYADYTGNVRKLATVVGSAGDDVLTGDDGLSERFQGSPGNDVVRYSGGHDRVESVRTFDTLGGSASQFTRVDNHVWEYLPTAGDGVQLSFVDRVLLGTSDSGARVAAGLESDSIPAQAYLLYKAAFDRAPDGAGVGYWIDRLDHGASMTAVAESFVASGEFKALYGADGTSATNAQVVDTLYRHILHRPGDAEGVAFWNGVLDRHAASVADVLLEFAKSPENSVAVIGAHPGPWEYLVYTGA